MRSFVLESALDVCHVKDPLETSGTDLYAVCRIGPPDEHSLDHAPHRTPPGEPLLASPPGRTRKQRSTPDHRRAT
jgi:hypothetical protein